MIRGIVGFADLTLASAAGEVLDAHIEAGQGRFSGIRHATAHDDDRRISRSHTRPGAGLMADSAFRRGVAELAKRDLSFTKKVRTVQAAADCPVFIASNGSVRRGLAIPATRVSTQFHFRH